MRLSLILCSRNDAYQGNSRWRLEMALNYLGERVEELGRAAEVEVVVADWGSDVPLHDVIRLHSAASRIVSFVWVPPELARSRQKDSTFPEVLALNAAARRSSGDYVGRIDQDTLVGGRFLRLFFDMVEGQQRLGMPHVTPETALFFANRRGIPYRFVATSPGLQQVSRFVRLFGRWLPVWRDNPDTGHLFWTSYVGIWLAHRDAWRQCGGYDERLIYYDWMETDMVCRLKQTHVVVDLGALTGHDFYHLEHYHPRSVAAIGRPHAKRNPAVDLSASPRLLNPNGDRWGLRDAPVVRGSASLEAARVCRSGPMAFAGKLARFAAETATDHAIIFCTARSRSVRRRLQPRRVAPR